MVTDARIADTKTPARVGHGQTGAPSPARETIRPVPGEPPPVSFATANAAVALAVVADLVFPPAWPAAAATLVGMNLRAFGSATRQLREGRLELPALYSSIAGLTLVTGQFIPWASMSWAMRFWKRGYRAEFVHARDRLLADLAQRPPLARVRTADGAVIEKPAEDLRPGETILLGGGDIVPMDGRVVSGGGLLDDRAIRGGRGYRPGRAEDDIPAGSRIVRGSFVVEMRPGTDTRAAALARIAIGALAHAPGERTPTHKGESFASRAVVPSLAAAGVGLMVGGAPMALATLRADYASGPGLSYPLELARALGRCSRRGIVVRDPDALDLFATADVLLIEDRPPLYAPEVEVAAVRIFPGHDEAGVLRYAASALLDLDDDRAPALRAACRERKISLLRGVSIEHGTDLTLSHSGRLIKVGNLGREQAARAGASSLHHDRDTLMVGIDGQIAGLVEFRHSTNPRSRADLAALRSSSSQPLAIGLISGSAEREAKSRAAALGADFHRGETSPADLARLIGRCRARGLKTAFVGECLASPEAARAADLAISLDGEGLEQAEKNPARIIMLRPDLAGLAHLAEAAREYRRHIRAAETTAVIPNLACAAGALLLGFSSLTNVAITNLGTFATYARTTRNLRGAQDERESDRRSPARGSR
ncbi:Copper-transporting P-type ATPase [Aquisphaera giovannonii]|uniref:Copper-transporting P-type ATPase n=1 Tax=Aquisphaera giovannonii TaxID=406548 RepID=A0A5B9VZR2_9BACT|nr:hypothetical protein [Aquisphaera giovannonii]QEH33170.1 Copper-transporting P-type ATPase [Aquisphaera giovannonii]